jgi:5-methylcytosine-specific restriction endonuclease McrA
VFEKNNDRRFFTKEMIDEKLKEQEGRCPLCNETITENQKYEADHILPWTNGGKTEKVNLQVLHQRCHKLKVS